MYPTAQTAQKVADLLRQVLTLDPHAILIRPSYHDGLKDAIKSIERRLGKNRFAEAEPTPTGD